MSAIIIPMDTARTSRALAQRASDLVAIGRRLVAARVAKGMRPVDLCAITGLTSNQLSNWESGANRPRVDQLARVLPVLDVTLDWIYLGDDRGLTWEVREKVGAALDALPPPAPVGSVKQAGG